VEFMAEEEEMAVREDTIGITDYWWKLRIIYEFRHNIL
jgi:hypothetical protein